MTSSGCRRGGGGAWSVSVSVGSGMRSGRWPQQGASNGCRKGAGRGGFDRG